MHRFRLLLAWIMMLAVPLQGFAAASMLLCGPGHGTAAVSSGFAGHAHAAGHSHDSAPVHSHGMHHDHPHEAAAQASSGPVAGPADSPEHTTASGAPHKCGVCASCCHAVAIAQAPHAFAAEPPPAQHRATPVAPVASRTVTLPDKPPRA